MAVARRLCARASSCANGRHRPRAGCPTGRGNICLHRSGDGRCKRAFPKSHFERCCSAIAKQLRDSQRQNHEPYRIMNKLISSLYKSPKEVSETRTAARGASSATWKLFLATTLTLGLIAICPLVSYGEEDLEKD